jgi:acyl-coenzyme A thioesterase PaaI-like protein
VAEGRLTDADGKLYATASTTCLVMTADTTTK